MAYFVLLFVAIIQFSLRYNLPNYIFDDTRHIYAGYISSLEQKSNFSIRSVASIIYQEFSNNSLREYRPLSFIQHHLSIIAYAGDILQKPLASMVVVAIGWGCVAALHFVFAQRFLGSCIWALVATFLFMTVMPVVSGSWIIVMGWQWVVQVVVLGGLLCYQNFKNDDRLRWIFLLICLGIIGPWFREFSGLFVFICLANEILFERKRSRLLILVLGILTLHVIFPAFISNLVLGGALKNISLTSIFRLGPIGQLSSGGATLLNLSIIRWDAVYHFLLLFPPLLWIIAAAGLTVSKAEIPISSIPKGFFLPALGEFVKTGSISGIIGILFVFIFILTSLGILGSNYSPACVMAALMLFGLVALGMLPRYPILCIYSFFSFVPFLKLYLHEVHLAYAAGPMAIILVTHAREWVRFLEREGKPIWRRFSFIATIFFLTVIVIDGALNPLASYLVVKGIYKGTQERATWIGRNIPKSSIVIGNFIDLRDILLYAPEHFVPYFSIAPNWEPNQVNTGAKLIDLIDRERGNRNIYLLGAVFPRLSGKYVYHHMHYLRVFRETASRRFAFFTRVVYPYADPLKYFIPAGLVSFPGPPDLVDDYWVGEERQRSPFIRETYAEYLLLRIDGVNDDQRIQLIESAFSLEHLVEKYRGYNIFRLMEDKIVLDPATGQPTINTGFVALSQTKGVFNLYDLGTSRKFLQCLKEKKCFKADSLEVVKSLIDKPL